MSKIKIFGLGGQNENGKNMYVVEVDDDIFVFDAGLKNADDRMLGVDYIIPNYDYLLEKKQRIKGIFVSHGHEEQYGALADILVDLPDITVYATSFTASMIKSDLENNGVKFTNLVEINPHKKLSFGNNSIFPISLTHSVPDAVGFVLTTEDGAIFYTGNYVFDSTMAEPYKTDVGKLAYVGKQGVLCLLSETMHAEKTGWTSPHHRIANIIKTTLNNTNHRVIFNVFQAELYRIQELFDEVEKTSRKVIILGKKLEQTIKAAIDQNYISFDKKRIANINEVQNDDVVLLISDEKEKPYSHLNRIVQGFDKFVKIKETDTVLFASSIYEGVEKTANNLFDEIAKQGASLIITAEEDFREYHASREDLMLMLNLIQPKYFMPVIGEYRAFSAAKEAALDVGVPEENVLMKLNGQVAQFNNGVYDDGREKIKVDDILIDGKTAGDVGEIVIKDREVLSENGVVIASIIIDKLTKKMIDKPAVTTKGFVFPEQKQQNEAIEIIKKVVDNNQKPHYIDFNKVKNEIRNQLGKFLFQKTDSKPMILVIMQEY